MVVADEPRELLNVKFGRLLFARLSLIKVLCKF
jgi:hypothetical protein